MGVIKLSVKELLYRKWMFFISIFLVAIAISSLVATRTISYASKNQITKFMKEMGTNLLILPAKLKVSNYWQGRFEEVYMPEDYVYKIASIPKIRARHFIAKLQNWININNQDSILTGIHPEIGPLGKNKKPDMSPAIEDENVILGYESAKYFNIKEGEYIKILGKKLIVKKINQPSGTIDDLRIYVSLNNAQKLLKKHDKINAIDALGCLCYGDFINYIKKQIEEVLPDTQVLVYRSIAVSRTKARLLIQKLGFYIQIILFALAGLVIAIYTFSNILERQEEISILSALGVPLKKIFYLFSIKLFLIAFLGGLFGFLLGIFISFQLGPKLLNAKITIETELLGISFIFAFLIVIISSAVPILKIFHINPAEILRKE